MLETGCYETNRGRQDVESCSRGSSYYTSSWRFFRRRSNRVIAKVVTRD